MDKRKRRIHKRRRLKRCVRVCILMIVIIVLGVFGIKILKKGMFWDKYVENTGSEIDASRPKMDVELLTVNAYSRPGTQVNRIRGIVIHYTANPGSTAMQNRNYFENLRKTKMTMASSHFIVGLEGEIVQCIPTWEVAYASNERNNDTVSIETCHLGEDGSYTDETYKSLVELTSWLCKKFDLTEEDVIRHYDVTGKICPKYFVENEQAWNTFKKDVKNTLDDM